MATEQRENAAIWWRVSTEDQGETSPDTQITESLALAHEEGYNVPKEYVLGTDWHSLSVWNSPQMERLKELIRSGAVQAVIMYDPDRGPSKPAHRLLLRALCEEHGVQIRSRYGQVPDGDMGEVMEFLSAWQKEKQVHRAQQGAKDGLRDRVLLRRLPANTRPAYGYRWERTQFVPDDNFPVAQGIWRMLLEGKTDRGVAGILTRAGVPTPTGKNLWNPSTIASIASNPVYCDRKIGLRWEGVEPKMRRGQTYGKSTSRLREKGQTVILDGLVKQPILTHEEFEQVQARRAKNKSYGGHKTRSYLLSGYVQCGVCGMRYSGTSVQRRRFPFGYRCGGSVGPIGRPRCPQRIIPGPWLEEATWTQVTNFLQDPPVFLMAVTSHEEKTEDTANSIRRTMIHLERQKDHYIAYKQRAYDGFVRGITDEVTYHRVIAGYQAHVTWLEQEIDRQQKDLDQAERKIADVETIRKLYPVLRDRLQRATAEDKRFVLECLGAHIVPTPDSITVELSIPEADRVTVTNKPGFHVGGIGLS